MLLSVVQFLYILSGLSVLASSSAGVSTF